MRRRAFLKWAFGVLGGAAGASVLYPLARTILPSAAASDTSHLVLNRKDLPPGAVKSVVFRDTPAIVIHHEAKGLLAFSRVCTHLGCLVELDASRSRFVCPCHAGSFDLDGNVISGPPPRPLQRLALRVDGENIIIG